MRVATTLRLILIAAALAGCGGSGTPAVTPPPDADFSALLQDQGALTAAGQQLSVSRLDTDTVIGTATYSGVIVYDEIGPTSGSSAMGLAGEVEIEVKLSNSQNAVTGTISDLVDTSNTEYDGVISLSSGQVDRTNQTTNGYAISARLSGDLSRPDGTDFTSDGGLDADFLGPELSMISGTSFLNLDSDGDSISLRGTLIADDP